MDIYGKELINVLKLDVPETIFKLDPKKNNCKNGNVVKITNKDNSVDYEVIITEKMHYQGN